MCYSSPPLVYTKLDAADKEWNGSVMFPQRLIIKSPSCSTLWMPIGVRTELRVLVDLFRALGTKAEVSAQMFDECVIEMLV